MPEPNTETPPEENLETPAEEVKETPEAPKEPVIEEPPVRKSAATHIIERKEKKIQKLEEAKETTEEVPEDFDPNDPKAVQKMIKKGITEGIKPLLDSTKRSSDDSELGEVIAKYGQVAEDLKPTIIKYMNNPAYAQVAVEFIFKGLIAKSNDIAEKKKEADLKTKKNSLIGSQVRKEATPDIPDVSKMSNKDFDVLLRKVKTKQFK